MINQTLQSVWGAGSSMLSPSCLIDKFLDYIETLSCALVPAQADGRSCPEEERIEALLD